MDPIVEIKNGSLRGAKSKDANGNEFYSFKGIRYGKPPVGDLRFKAPQPAEPWTGVKDAIEHGNVSLGKNMLDMEKLMGAEDCLFLNVYTPTLSKKSLPVMVFIHGGGFMHGSGNDDLIGPEFFMTEDVILVTINYRLGALGFMAFDNPNIGVPGNAGLKDQVLALKWVQENINHFGGNKDNVTIFGESAGSASTHYLLLTPLAKSLFHRAILQSGTSNTDWALDKRYPHSFAKALGCSATDDQAVYQFLKNVPAEELILNQTKVLHFEESIIGICWGPTIEVPCSSEPAFITEHPNTILSSGNFNKVPTIYGYTSGEGLLFLSKLLPPSKTLNPGFTDNAVLVPRDLRSSMAISKQIGDEIKRYYYKDETPSADNAFKFVDVTTDLFFLVPMYFSAVKHASKSHDSVYIYRFAVEDPTSVFKALFGLTLPGTCHGEELAYLFTNFLNKEYPPKDTLAYKTVKRLIKLWATFARHGNPNSHGDKDLINVEWKPITADECNYLNIAENLESAVDPEKERIQFWKNLYDKYNNYVQHKL